MERKYAGVTKCPCCNTYIEYTDSDIKAKYIQSVSKSADGIDVFTKWVECPKCGKKVDL